MTKVIFLHVKILNWVSSPILFHHSTIYIYSAVDDNLKKFFEKNKRMSLFVAFKEKKI